jgi:ATP-dependent DNA helicase RecQ
MNLPEMTTGIEPETEHSSLLREQLQKNWGYPDFRPLQREAMTLVMSDRDSLVVLPTGGGKSLCYQVPAISREGLALIVSPLISLMKDQVDSLQTLGIKAACINSMQSQRDKLEVADQIRRRELKLLYIAPERLVQARTIEFLAQSKVSFIAVDEAHCISQWGHDFRPEYRQLSSLREVFPGVSIHGYTATATPQVRSDIVEQLGLKDAQVLVGSFDRPNLLYRVERRGDSVGQIQQILKRHKGETGIIYCISRKNVEATSSALNQLGFRTLPYHAGLSDDDRRRSQEAFIEEKVDIIVATVAFGMGIDKSNVRFVIHAEMPKSLEHYQQESGRAGRDGLEAECTLLYSPADAEIWTYLMNDVEDAAVRASAESSLRSMRQYCTSMRCRHQLLVEHFGQKLESLNCGACDVCLKEMQPVEEPLVIAQKILSSVIRQGERFGAAYTAQVLKGSKNKRISENGHDSLSTWGLLKSESELQIRSWIDQLVSQGFMRSAGEYNCLQVTTAGRQLLKGQTQPVLLRARTTEKVAATEDKWEGVDRDLFEELRGMRNRLAIQKNVPPYIVFGDGTLRALAAHRPTTREGLQQIQGIGVKKMQEFGPVVLFTIQQWCEQHQLATNVGLSLDATELPAETKRTSVRSVTGSIPEEYVEYFEQRIPVEEIADQLDRTADTVVKHLTVWIQQRRITEIGAWVTITQQKLIEDSLGRLGAERLKPLFDDLKGEIPYYIIRLVITVWELKQQEDN